MRATRPAFGLGLRPAPLKRGSMEWSPGRPAFDPLDAAMAQKALPSAIATALVSADGEEQADDSIRRQPSDPIRLALALGTLHALDSAVRGASVDVRRCIVNHGAPMGNRRARSSLLTLYSRGAPFHPSAGRSPARPCLSEGSRPSQRGQRRESTVARQTVALIGLGLLLTSASTLAAPITYDVFFEVESVPNPV